MKMSDGSVKKTYQDKRWYDDVGGKNPLCSSCRHRLPFDAESGVVKCDAFPNGIPRYILIKCEGERNIADECQNGIRFERL